MGFFPQMIVLRQDYMPNRDKPIQIDNAKEMQVGITIRAKFMRWSEYLESRA